MDVAALIASVLRTLIHSDARESGTADLIRFDRDVNIASNRVYYWLHV